MEKCTEQFSSRDVGASVSDVECLLVSLTELEDRVGQTVEAVHSQGKKLLETLTATSGMDTSRRRSDDHVCVCVCACVCVRVCVCVCVTE